MNVKCPWCGAVGHDQKPYPEGMTMGPHYKPPKGVYAFEVRGNYGGRPVRKCLNCGNGVRVTLLPPRFRKVPPDEWADLQVRWEQFKRDQDEHFAARERGRDEAND